MSLIRELETLIHVGRHPNIVSLVGACTFEGEKNLLIITIFMILSKAHILALALDSRCAERPVIRHVISISVTKSLLALHNEPHALSNQKKVEASS